MRINKLWRYCCLFAASLLLFGCAHDEFGNCVDRGSGMTSTDTSFQIDASADKWIATNIVAVGGEEMRLIIDGEVNLCGDQTENEKQVTVHANKCSDGTNIRYPANVNTFYSAPINNLCPSGNFAYAPLEKTDSGIRARAGDGIVIELVPTTVTLTSCTSPPAGVILDSGRYDLNASGSATIPVAEICQNGGTIYLNGEPFEVDPMEGTTYTLSVSNDMAPSGNKVMFGRSAVPNSPDGQHWYLGSLLDLRLKDSGTDVESYDCSRAVYGDYVNTESVKINKNCGTFCYTQQLSQSSAGGNCVGTYHMPSTSSQVDYGYGPIEVENPILAPTGEPIHYARFLDLYVGNDLGANRNGDVRIADVSLGKPMIIDNSVGQTRKPLSFHIWGSTDSSGRGNTFGGYTVKIKRQCMRNSGENLYIYVGSEDPNNTRLTPGSAGTYHIGDRTAFNQEFFINRSSDTGTNSLAGQVYFRVKTNTDEVAKGAYNIVLRENRPPTFVSKAFEWFFNQIAFVFRGPEDANGQRNGGIMRAMYHAVLNDVVRKVIYLAMTIYIAITGLGYLTGISHASYKDFMHRVLRLSFVGILINDGSWDVLSIYVLPIVLNGTDWLMKVFGDFYGAGGRPFQFLDSIVGLIFNPDTFAKLLSLFFDGLIGWAFFFVACWAFWRILCAMGILTIAYVISYMAISVLIPMWGVFMALMIVTGANRFFKSYINILLTLIAQVGFGFANISIMMGAILLTIRRFLDFSACSECLIALYFGSDGGSHCLLGGYITAGYSNSLNFEDRSDAEMYRDESRGEHFLGMPMSLNTLLQLWIYGELSIITTKIAMVMPEGIFSIMFMSTRDAVASAGDSLKGLVGQDQESKSRRKDSHLRKKNEEEREEKQQNREKGATGGNDDKKTNSDSLSGGKASVGLSDSLSAPNNKPISSDSLTGGRNDRNDNSSDSLTGGRNDNNGS